MYVLPQSVYQRNVLCAKINTIDHAACRPRSSKKKVDVFLSESRSFVIPTPVSTLVSN